MANVIDIHDSDSRERALQALRDGGVVVLPTDTLYGLSTMASSYTGVERIREIKGSGDEKRFLVVASSIDMVSRYVDSFGSASEELLERVWPAPLTAVMPAGGDCPDWIGDTIAVRVPAFGWLRRLVEALGEPLVSTSVNRSGEAALDDIDEIIDEFGGEVDLIVAGDEGAYVSASTIVDLTGDETEVLREGDYDWDAATGD